MEKKILIAGGTGLLGNAVKEKLLSNGHEVRILTRDAERAQQLGYYHYNKEKGQIDKEAIDQIDILINLAGANVIEKPWTINRKRILRESRIDLNRYLLKVLEEAGQKPELFISASAVGVYGDRGDEVISENSEPGSASFIVDLCLDWEKSAADFSRLGSRVICARISNVIAKSEGFFPKILESTRFGVLPVLGDGKQYVSWIHIDDFAALILKCIDDKNLKGPVNFCTQNAISYEDLVQTVKKAKGKNWLSPKTPKLVLKAMMGERAHLLFDSLRCEPGKALDSGFSFKYPDLKSAIQSP